MGPGDITCFERHFRYHWCLSTSPVSAGGWGCCLLLWPSQTGIGGLRGLVQLSAAVSSLPSAGFGSYLVSE